MSGRGGGGTAGAPVRLPAGLDALYGACRNLYPLQTNPLQVTALIKYWLGGPDPLDYISMYYNEGDPKRDIPQHWHYISFGLSDLHGDGRVHVVSGADTPSGFGLELTFRLKKEPGQMSPPTWPATLMQNLAKYVFQTDNVLYAGDHVSWHNPLDNSESRIQHMLMMQDPELATVRTPFGPVNFVQIIGVCAEELQAAQHWNGPGVINLMKTVKGVGGPYLVTDMRRGETIFELDPQVQEAVDQGIENAGSNLSGVSARCSWLEADVHYISSDEGHASHLGPGVDITSSDFEARKPKITEMESVQIKLTLYKGLEHTSKLPLPISSGRNDSDNSVVELTRKESYDSSSDGGTLLESAELTRPRPIESVHITLNLEAAALLPLAFRGRLKHGRHFTFKSVLGDLAITFLVPSVLGAFVSREQPMACQGPWLQVLLKEEAIERMMKKLEILGANKEELKLPKTFAWPEWRIAITVLPDTY